jgi:hypothetical protein
VLPPSSGRYIPEDKSELDKILLLSARIYMAIKRKLIIDSESPPLSTALGCCVNGMRIELSLSTVNKSLNIYLVFSKNVLSQIQYLMT